MFRKFGLLQKCHEIPMLQNLFLNLIQGPVYLEDIGQMFECNFTYLTVKLNVKEIKVL